MQGDQCCRRHYDLGQHGLVNSLKTHWGYNNPEIHDNAQIKFESCAKAAAFVL